ncbi:TetR/AcrR family transcriptional regulator [Desulfosoma caldarium]|uniref:TetR family transcriptional regulator n=1 Tax=Desulfosoma caldarium TaxID=610254 RepID=A0A3N1UIG2_9BACT|nr:TetR/AcrR family transcriptional regulator [Desulfosoma caldarium]ROQ91055.1 TetR family transcriptional regulator [Desulfosoma caldarium]
MGMDRFMRLKAPKRERIVEAAVEEFSRHGFRQASLNRLAESLGISKGSLFQYFGNKEGLFLFIFDHAVELVRQRLARVKQDTADKDFFDKIRQSLMAGVDFLEKHPRVYRIYLKMLFQEDFPMRDQLLQRVRFFSAEYLRPIVLQGMARGELRSDLDPDFVVFFLDAVMDRFLQAHCVAFLDGGMGLYEGSRDATGRVIDDFITVLRNGLAGDGVASQEKRTENASHIGVQVFGS